MVFRARIVYVTLLSYFNVCKMIDKKIIKKKTVYSSMFRARARVLL